MATTRLFLLRPLPFPHSSSLFFLRRGTAFASAAKNSDPTKNKKERITKTVKSLPLEEHLKKRTCSLTEFDCDIYSKYTNAEPSTAGGGHAPVMLGEVLQVFRHSRLRSFVDCTLGSAGHSSALYVGLDIDPVAHEKGRVRIVGLLKDSEGLRAYTHLRNFKHIKSVLGGIDENLLSQGVNGILMDLGMSSMQVNHSERGFSVLGDGPLDMLMHPQMSYTGVKSRLFRGVSKA